MTQFSINVGTPAEMQAAERRWWRRTVRESDTYQPQVGDIHRNPFTGEERELVSLDPIAFVPIRDPGDYVGRHRLSYAWGVIRCNNITFKTNLFRGPVSRHV